MSPHLQRAQLLIQQGRYADAERELGLALAQHPDEARAHALLGLCLLDRQQFEEASSRGRQAIALAPDSADIRHLAARIEGARNQLDDALRLYSEAIALDPYDSRYFAGRAGVHAVRKAWQQTLDDCQRALALNPEETEAINLRATANRGLGRTEEGAADIEQALKINPYDAYSHANLGWTRLQQGDLKQAETHFREALRIDPELEWARAGVLEATKAKFPPYRWLLAYFLWMSQRTGAVQIAIIAGLWFGSRVVAGLAASFPTAAPLLWGLLGAYLLACVATWIARPLSNSVLLLHPFGRLALTRQEKIEAGVVMSWFAVGVAVLLGGFFQLNDLLVDVGFALLRVWLAVTMAFQMRAKQPRKIMIGAAVVIAILSLVQMGGIFWIGLMIDQHGEQAALEIIPTALSSALKTINPLLLYSPLIVLFGASYLQSQNWVEK